MGKVKREWRPGPVVIERAVYTSKAWRDLNGIAKTVLADFWMKRSFGKVGGVWVQTNNGELEYTYKDADTKGITSPRFTRAIDDLIGAGFLDISKTGAGVFKATTLYALSDRWKNYGTEMFKVVGRPKKSRWHDGIGFQKK